MKQPRSALVVGNQGLSLEFARQAVTLGRDMNIPAWNRAVRA
jgi:hypothetical protein